MYISHDIEEQKRIFVKKGLSVEADAVAIRNGEDVTRWMFPLGFIKWKPKVIQMRDHFVLLTVLNLKLVAGRTILLAANEMGRSSVLCYPTHVCGIQDFMETTKILKRATLGLPWLRLLWTTWVFTVKARGDWDGVTSM